MWSWMVIWWLDVIQKWTCGELEVSLVKSVEGEVTVKMGFSKTRSPPTKANRVESQAWSLDFRKWKSSRTVPLADGYSRGSPIFPVPSFRHDSIFTSITLICSQGLPFQQMPTEGGLLLVSFKLHHSHKTQRPVQASQESWTISFTLLAEANRRALNWVKECLTPWSSVDERPHDQPWGVSEGAEHPGKLYSAVLCAGNAGLEPGVVVIFEQSVVFRFRLSASLSLSHTCTHRGAVCHLGGELVVRTSLLGAAWQHTEVKIWGYGFDQSVAEFGKSMAMSDKMSRKTGQQLVTKNVHARPTDNTLITKKPRKPHKNNCKIAETKNLDFLNMIGNTATEKRLTSTKQQQTHKTYNTPHKSIMTTLNCTVSKEKTRLSFAAAEKWSKTI
ncbi:hypothetical protein PR048_005262 [Dryococelus australis]|uniref:Uncharacterized protein n=1 Tax=Dryococelus australis TaxID=614101 RepID=A0ABQ9I7R7_9NEOP|nr:hypothetical protein PR048_005262 [Dryococelus australis]